MALTWSTLYVPVSAPEGLNSYFKSHINDINVWVDELLNIVDMGGLVNIEATDGSMKKRCL